MGVHQLHLVLEPPSDADDHVADHGFDGTETSYVFTSAVPDGEDDLGVFGGLDLREGEGAREKSTSIDKLMTKSGKRPARAIPSTTQFTTRSNP
jgi:hypothetical protein